MNLINKPQLLDQLAASYALGSLRGGARRRFEALAQSSLTVRTAGLLWQERMASLNELQAAQAPSENVWKRIQISLAAQQQKAPGLAAEPGLLAQLRSSLRLWRGVGLAGALGTVAAVLVGVSQTGQWRNEAGTLGTQVSQLQGQVSQLNGQLQAAPAIAYVAVLTDDKAAASLLATFDAKSGKLTLKRLGNFAEGADKSLQLWALPGQPKPGQSAGAPKSLGVLGSEAVIRLVADGAQVSQVPALAISLEPKGGVSGEAGPSGPVLFKGELIQTAL